MLILETGEGLPNSNSYIDLEYADAFFDQRGEGVYLHIQSIADNKPTVAWFGDDASRTAALIRATSYIDSVYGPYLISVMLNPLQALQFPRKSCEGLPSSLKKATALYALHALQGPLVPRRLAEMPVSGEDTRKIVKKREKIGPIEEETVYQEGTSTYAFQHFSPFQYPEADLTMQSLLIPSAQGFNGGITQSIVYR